MSNYTLHITPDYDAQSPRANCTLGILVTFMRRHCFGDEKAVRNVVEEIQKNSPGFDFSPEYDHPTLLENACHKAGFILIPVYAYIHGDITISSTPFGCKFDSGKAGFIVATKSAIRETFGIKRITTKYIEKAKMALQGEIEELDRFFVEGGQAYTLYKNGVPMDSCGGFIGCDYKTNGMLDNIGLDKDALNKMKVVDGGLDIAA